MDIKKLAEDIIGDFKNFAGIKIETPGIIVARPVVFKNKVGDQELSSFLSGASESNSMTVFVIPVPKSKIRNKSQVFAGVFEGRKIESYIIQLAGNVILQKENPDCAVMLIKGVFPNFNTKPTDSPDTAPEEETTRFINKLFSEWLGVKVFAYYQCEIINNTVVRNMYRPYEDVLPAVLKADWKQALEKSVHISGDSSFTVSNISSQIVGSIPADERDLDTILEKIFLEISIKAKSFLKLNEESIRDIVYVALSTHYEFEATSESICKNGKTDLIIKDLRDDDMPAILEFKIWRGPKKLHKAQKQLLGYSSGNELFIALVVINKDNENLRILTGKIQDEIPNLECVVKERVNHMPIDKARNLISTSDTEVRGYSIKEKFYLIDLVC